MQDVYFISGLGADERIFQYLRLSGIRAHYVRWITPGKGETMGAYAERLLEQVDTENPVLVGMSMGGMIAMEMSKRIRVKKVILISSACTSKELPPYFRLLGIFPLHNWLPYRLLTKAGLLVGAWLFGASGEADKKLLKEIMYDTDKTFFCRAWGQIIRWKNNIISSPVFHIHGDRDRILPLRFVRADYIVRGGTHLMVINKAEEVSLVIQQQIAMLDTV